MVGRFVDRTNKSEDWLALLLYSADILLNPSPAKILGGFESWDYQNRFSRQVRRLQHRQLLRPSRIAGKRTFRLTQQGRLTAHGGRDPFECWERAWDDKWRIVLFDLPTHRQSARVKLIRWLREHHFGCLQRSVWVHPDPAVLPRPMLQEWAGDAARVTVVEARCLPGYSDRAIVVGAWNFQEINQAYERYLRVADQASQYPSKARTTGHELANWLRVERTTWLDAVSRDPLLPEPLLPAGYLGKRAAAARKGAVECLRQRWGN
jgi:phenylacetic acid degradation operon negative regulatory protein